MTGLMGITSHSNSKARRQQKNQSKQAQRPSRSCADLRYDNDRPEPFIFDLAGTVHPEKYFKKKFGRII